MDGHASGCLLSALGAGMPYNREREKNLVCTPLTSIQDYVPMMEQCSIRMNVSAFLI